VSYASLLSPDISHQSSVTKDERRDFVCLYHHLTAGLFSLFVFRELRYPCDAMRILFPFSFQPIFELYQQNSAERSGDLIDDSRDLAWSFGVMDLRIFFRTDLRLALRRAGWLVGRMHTWMNGSKNHETGNYVMS
jgi:hypothetical protein